MLDSPYAAPHWGGPGAEEALRPADRAGGNFDETAQALPQKNIV